MEKTTRNILIGTGVFLLCPLALLPAVALGFGGVLTYKGIKKVKKGYVEGKRAEREEKPTKFKFFKGKKEIEKGVGLVEDLIKVGKFSKTGFVKIGAHGDELKPLKITTLLTTFNSSTNSYETKEVVLRSYDHYNQATGCAEIPTRPFEHVVEENGKKKIEICDRVVVKLNKEGKIDWASTSNKKLFSNPKAVGEVLRRYPESFRTIPNEVLHEKLAGTEITMGDYLQRVVKKEAQDRLNDKSEYSSIVPRRPDGKAVTKEAYIKNLHKMMQSKVNDYISMYGASSSPFDASAGDWLGSRIDDSYFSE